MEAADRRRCFGGVLRLQIRLQDVGVTIGLFQAVQLQILDVGENLFTIEDGRGRGKRVGCLDRWLALDKGEPVRANAVALEHGAGDVQINFIAPTWT